MPFPSGTLNPASGLYPSEADNSYVPVASPVRPTWDEMLRGPHVVARQATLLVAGTAVMSLPVVDGGVTLDSTAATRGRLDLTIAGRLIDAAGVTNLVPRDPSDPLAPYGNEIAVSRGVRYPGGGVELVPLGVFGIYETQIGDDGGGVQVQLAGLDRSQRIIDARFEQPYQIAAGTNYGTAILTTIQAAYPDVAYNFTPTALTAPTTLIAEEGSDRWAFCQSMATACGLELFFNGAGTLILRPVVQAVGGTPDVSLVEGEGGVLVAAASTWTRDGAYNRIIATGESTGENTVVPRGVATDLNPLSPTYYYGPFGRVPTFFVSQMIRTDQQAADAAAAQLGKQLGTSRRVSFGTVVNPRIQPGTVVQITRERTGIDELQVVDSITCPLSATGTMTGATRAVQVYT